MTSLKIDEADIPRLDGKFVIITGGSSGIGLATVRILCSNGAKVHILDLYPPSEEDGIPSGATFAKCNVASWTELRQAFDAVRGERIDIAIANAGVSETSDFLDDSFDTAGVLQQPNYEVLDVNLRAVLNFVKLAVRSMRRGDERKIDDDKGMNDSEPGGGGEKKGRKGSIVIISSATAFAPEQSLPVYSATKSALIGLVRALRSTLPLSNITINAVAPAATLTKLLPRELATPLMAAGLPVSTAHMVGLAVVYSAIATQQHRVEDYGKDMAGRGLAGKEGEKGRWNGRTILTLGDGYTEVEEVYSRLRPGWMGEENARLTRLQQAATDFRGE